MSSIREAIGGFDSNCSGGNLAMTSGRSDSNSRGGNVASSTTGGKIHIISGLN